MQKYGRVIEGNPKVPVRRDEESKKIRVKDNVGNITQTVRPRNFKPKSSSRDHKRGLREKR